jgi:hypothetical protein
MDATFSASNRTLLPGRLVMPRRESGPSFAQHVLVDGGKAARAGEENQSARLAQRECGTEPPINSAPLGGRGGGRSRRVWIRGGAVREKDPQAKWSSTRLVGRLAIQPHTLLVQPPPPPQTVPAQNAFSGKRQRWPSSADGGRLAAVGAQAVGSRFFVLSPKSLETEVQASPTVRDPVFTTARCRPVLG